MALKSDMEDDSIGRYRHSHPAPDSTGKWLPLPQLLSGVCIYPFRPYVPPIPKDKDNDHEEEEEEEEDIWSTSHHRNRFSWSGLTSPVRPHGGASKGKGTGRKEEVNPYEIPLDVGDEFFAFEQFLSTSGGVGAGADGRGETWYRGYIIQGIKLLALMPGPSTIGPVLEEHSFPRPEASVLIGIFPASAVHIRPGSVYDHPDLQAAYSKAVKMAGDTGDMDVGAGSALRLEGDGTARTPTQGQAQEQARGAMDPVQEEDEAGASSPEKDGNGGKRAEEEIRDENENHDEGSISTPTPMPKTTYNSENPKRKSLPMPTGLARVNRPKSLILSQQTPQAGVDVEREKEAEKGQAPLPQLTAGDSTLAGQSMPIVDEIACAVREWYARLPTYLAHKEYRLFSTVAQHIDALLLGRRQLLSQTLSDHELVRVKRECVSRLVKCNVAQGLEVIVRSLDDGSVIVVNKDKATTDLSRVSGITAYVYQVQLAYIDLIPLGTLFGKEHIPVPSVAQKLSLPAIGKSPSTTVGAYYHFFLDVRAFIATPCAPGETAELFFSLFNKAEGRFISEEYLLVLNHLGTPARDAEQRLGRLRTLFTQLKQEDINGGLFLVCRLVRNGALKMRSEPGSAMEMHGQTSSSGRRSMLRPTGSHIGNSRTAMGRSQASVLSTITDDSWSITSGFAGHRTQTIDTTHTVTPSIVDGRPSYRRPLGVAILELPQLAKLLGDGTGSGLDKGGMEFSMPIFAPRDEAGFATLHTDIIGGRMANAVTSSRAESIAVGVGMLHGEAPTLVRDHPLLLADVPLTERLGFPDVVAIGTNHERNALYIKLWSATFSPSHGSGGGSIRIRPSNSGGYRGNVQISLELRNADGTYIPDAMYAGGSGELAMSSHQSICFTGIDEPTYGELVKVRLPHQSTGDSTDQGGVHLYLTFRSRGKDRSAQQSNPSELERPFAFAFLPLTGRRAVKDDTHELVLYKTDGAQHGPGSEYLDLLSPGRSGSVDAVPNGETSRPGGMVALRDRVTVRTLLVSTSISQDETLQEVLGWPSSTRDLGRLGETLKRFAFVDEAEISKFLPRILDSLFAMLVYQGNDRPSNENDEPSDIGSQIFSALTKVLSMSTDRRFPNFSSVLDDYLAHHFNHPASSSRLLSTMKRIMSPSNANTSEYRSFLKVWHLFFRFIIRSRQLDRARGVGLDATSAHIESEFRRQVKGVLIEINNLMESQDVKLIGSKTLAVQHYADLLPSLAHVFPPEDLASMVIEFTDTLTMAKGNLAVYKLLLILQVVREIFDSADARGLLVPAIVRWVKPHLGKYDDGLRLMDWEGGKGEGKDKRRVKWLECNRLATTVVAWTVDRLQTWLESPVIQEEENLRRQEEDNIEYCLELLPALCESYAELNGPSTEEALQRLRAEGTSAIWKATPDIFPISHPFSLISSLPPPSLIEQHRFQREDEAGMADNGTFHPGLAECAIVILTLFLATPKKNIDNYLIELLDIQGRAATAKRLRLVIDFAKSVVAGDPFPRNWLTVNLIGLSAVVKILYGIADLIQRPEFVPPVDTANLVFSTPKPQSQSRVHNERGEEEDEDEDAPKFDVDIWTGIFELLSDYCASEQLALEDQTTQRRRACWIIVGDLRDEGITLLARLWESLSSRQAVGGLKYGGYQSRFLGLSHRILGLCLSSHDQLCEMAVDILFSMMLSEHAATGRFATVENEIFNRLDGLFSSKHMLESTESTLRAYFVTQLRRLFESHTSLPPDLSSAFVHFLTQVERFIELLMQLRDLPRSTEWRDERADAIFQLMEFVQTRSAQIGGDNELYIRFVQQLVRTHLEVGDTVAAGHATYMHALLYDWEGEGTAPPCVLQGTALPVQSAFARRESLYYEAIDYFAEGRAFESALELCHDLTTQHTRLTYNLDRLVELYSHQASLWSRIGEEVRPRPTYIRVVYFNQCTPVNQGKDFIVRCLGAQKFPDFVELLESKFPDVTIHRNKIPPTQILIDSEDVIWVMPVLTEPDPTHPALKEGVNSNVQEHHRFYGGNTFVSFRPFSKIKPASGADGGTVVKAKGIAVERNNNSNEGLLMWVEKTILTTQENLPGALNRSEVIEIRYEQISPVASAIAEVRKAGEALKKLYRPRSGHAIDTKMLGTAINGAVDSPVSGGVQLYRETFLESSFLRENPEFALEINDLRATLMEYAGIVADALRVHGKLCKDIAFHEALKSHFYRSFPDEAASFSRSSESTSDHFHYHYSTPGGGVGAVGGAGLGLGASTSTSTSKFSIESQFRSSAGQPPASSTGPTSILKPSFPITSGSSYRQEYPPTMAAAAAASPSRSSLSLQGTRVRLPTLRLGRGPRGPVTRWINEEDEEESGHGHGHAGHGNSMDTPGTGTGIGTGNGPLSTTSASGSPSIAIHGPTPTVPSFPNASPNLGSSQSSHVHGNSPRLGPGSGVGGSSSKTGSPQLDPPAAISGKARSLLGGSGKSTEMLASKDGLPALPLGDRDGKREGGQQTQAQTHDQTQVGASDEGRSTPTIGKKKGDGMMKRLSTLVRRDSTRQ